MSPATSQGSSSHICRSLHACVHLSIPQTGDKSREDAGSVYRDDGMITVSLDAASHQGCHSSSAVANQELNNVSSDPPRSVPSRTAEAFGEVFPYCL